MFSHRLDQTAKRSVVLHWFLLSFNGGCINAGGFLATGRFVSHVTGFATLFGVDVINRDFGQAIGILSVPSFFLLGAFIAGSLIDRPLHFNQKPHFDYVMGLAALCLFIAAGGGELLQFGFGSIVKLQKSYLILVLLCLACGLQNGAITSSSGSTVRTTHLTGLTTDLGLGLARILTYYADKSKFARNAYVNELRIGSILSYILGSVVGAWFFMHLEYRGFILPGCIAAYAAWRGRNAKVVEHRDI